MSRVRIFISIFVLLAAPLAIAQEANDTTTSQLTQARRYIDTGRYWEASQIADRILAVEPDNQQALQLKQDALKGLKEHQQQRLREAEELAMKSNATPEDRLALADAYFRAGRYLSAADIYETLPENLRDREVRLREARALAWAGRMYEAEPIYVGLLSEREDPELRLEYGRLLSWMGTSKLAVERLRSVYDETHSEDALEALVNALAWSGNREEAIRVLSAHIASNPNSERARQMMSDIGRTPDLQLERIGRMIEVEPYNLALRLERARLLLEMGRYGEAAKTIEFIEEHSQQPVEGLADLKQQVEARRREQLVRLKTQKEDLDAKDPQTAEQIHELAKAYVGIQEYAEAIRLYEAYLKLRPDDTKARIEYARVLGWDRRYDASQRQYEKLLAQYPDRADLRLEYAKILSYDEEYVPAIREFRELTSLSENPRARLYEDVPPQAHFSLGQIYRWFGWQEHAVEQQNAAIELDTGYAPARRELDLVRRLRPATNVDARYTFAEDSNDFEMQRFDVLGQKWTSPRTAIDGWVGRHQFSRDDDEVNATVLGIGGRYRFQDRLLGWGRVGANLYDEGLGTSPFWNLGTQYRPSIQSRVSAEYAHYDLVYDVFTVQSLREDPLDIDDFRLHWDYNTGGFWSYLADGSFGMISDDNDRAALHGIVAFRVFKSPYVAIKADGRYLSYDFRSDRYWSPTEYESLAGVLAVGDNYRDRLYWTAELKYGKSWEETRSGERVDRDLRALEGRLTVPINDMFDVVGAYSYGKSGRLEGVLPAGDDFTTYWARRWYVGLRVKRLFRDEEARGRNPYYFEDRPVNESPIVPYPPIGEGQ